MGALIQKTDELSTEEIIHSLFEQFANDVFRYARLTLGNAHDAKDVVQEVFLRAYRGWSDFRHDANEKTWLMQIARHYLVDLIRKRQTERTYLTSYEPPIMVNQQISIETMMMLEQTLATLNPAYQHVFVLRHIQQFTVIETAEILGWTQAKVRTVDHRAIYKIRQLMGDERTEVGHQNEVGK